ncbi:MAG: AAA family ATPase [Pseudomonadota bacterium]
MKRDAYKKLMEWRISPARKPLLLRGARQTGKTYLLKAFGNSEYDTLLYFNFEEDPLLKELFNSRVRPSELIRNLSIYSGRQIRPDKDLLVFDEIQSSNGALKSLKYFNEDMPELHIAAAGSLLGIALSRPGAFPVGKVDFLDLFPMTFFEFLEAIGESQLKEYLSNIREAAPLPEPIHRQLIGHLRTYYVTGGMPEAVDCYSKTQDLLKVRKIQKDILTSYTLDFAKYAAAPDIPKLSMVWDAVPGQLGKENKKFLFSNLKESARLREFENALEWLEKSGLILRSFRAKTAKQPLKAYLEKNIFKLYALDVGLLGAMAKIDPAVMVQGDLIFREFEGALVENYVAQQLKARHEVDIYYWQSGGEAEVDFIFEFADMVLPLEAKAGVNPRSKSLKSFDQKYAPAIMARTTLLNLNKNARLINIPLYAIALFPEICFY